jgi:hypothetical protein
MCKYSSWLNLMPSPQIVSYYWYSLIKCNSFPLWIECYFIVDPGSCRAPLPSNALCTACRPTVKCRRCYRNLPQHLFATTSSDTCMSCSRRSTTIVRKYALGKDVQEYRLPITDDDMGVDEYLQSNAGNITDVLQSAISRLVWVLLWLL